MNAILKIYKDCSIEEASKIYTCRRLLYGVAKKLETISLKSNKATPEEQEQYTIDFLKTIFPDFEDDDLNYIDTTEYMEFVKDIGLESQRIIENAQKN